MRRVLIVSPHFPPTDVVDMHRVRLNVRHYRDYGWEPVVLAVEPRASGRLIDLDLAHTVPDDIRIYRTGAFPESLARMAGVSALGLRAHARLGAAGDAIIRELKPDLAFFSTTCFPVMTLGARWRRRFGLPYVLDMQDPWFTGPPSAQQFKMPGLKAAAMRALHKGMERRAMESASGLISVSADYLAPLREAYPSLATAPSQAIPFGHDPNDLAIARRYGRRAEFEFEAGPGLTAVSAGRGGSDMISSFQTLFAILTAGIAQGSAEIARLRLAFLGTGYQRSNNPHVVAPLAAKAGVDDRVAERPDRVSLLDAQRTLAEADLLVIVGSDDLAYQPSKLFQYLATDRPIICVAPAGGQFARVIEGVESVFMISTDADPLATVGPLSAWLARFAGNAVEAGGKRKALTETYSAASLARRECAVFDQALNGAGQTGGGRVTS